MQTSTKQLVKSEMSDLLAEILECHKRCDQSRRRVAEAQHASLHYALETGIRLLKMKALIPAGDWLLWIDSNLTFSERSARLYMKIASDNPEAVAAANRQRVAGSPLDFQPLKTLKFDTIRKYAIGFVPEKAQPDHKGNAKFGRSISFLNIVNEYDRLKQRHLEKLQLINFDEAREETIELTRKLNFIQETKCPHCGSVIAASDPWA